MSDDDKAALAIIAIIFGVVGLFIFLVTYPTAVIEFFSNVFRALSP